ncbi:MAG TPA: glycerophosphodiester phosphodiesterase, partial [Solirubrobacteraceae bacterium]
MRAAVLAVLVAALLAAPAEAGTLYIHAHRGGPASYGAPENSLEAFERAAADGFVVELDVKLAKDRVPVVIHDDALDRTTTCTGPVAARTAADLRDCVLKGSARGEPVPRLTDALDLLRRTGARANVEIKNLPTDGDYEPGTAYAEAVIAVLRAAALPSRQLIVQSFDPQNLQAAEAALPGVDTSLLTLGPLNPGSPVFAKGTGYEYVSPEYGTGLSPELVADAHAGGKRVVPYTVDTPEGVRAAAAAGIDEIITNDPRMARRALKEVEPPAAIPPPPSPEACRSVRASRTLAPAEAFDAAGGASTPRVFAMQFKQDARHVDDYAAYRTKIECLIREWVVPRMVPGRPTVVAFNEDVGLATIATGSRGAAAREAVTKPGGPSCEGAGAPCATLAALGAIRTSYGKEVTAYRGRFERMSPIADAFVAATDTFARGWMQTFCDMARRYGVYILGSNNQAPFRESTDPSEIAAFRDPDLPAAPPTVYVATSDAVFNEVFLWGPSDVREEGPRPLRNVVASNKKVPLTPIEEQLQLRNGPATGPDAVDNLRPFALPGTGARIGFATSLPAFVYGSVPAGGDPCADVTKTYMRCLDALGANLVMQDEANPGRWAGPGGRSPWQPLEWMDSTWRAVSDPSVGFAYNVTPHLVGNLADLAFDGQTAITQRGLDGGAGCRYVGNGAALDEDPAPFRAYAGTKREFLALVPWVAPDGPRDALRAVAARLAPGSGDKLENDYVETAIAADLPFPPNPARVGCAGADGVARPA